jgi:DNA-directed RNA polymerase subunit RPC12/RpoP
MKNYKCFKCSMEYRSTVVIKKCLKCGRILTAIHQDNEKEETINEATRLIQL